MLASTTENEHFWQFEQKMEAERERGQFRSIPEILRQNAIYISMMSISRPFNLETQRMVLVPECETTCLKYYMYTETLK